MKVTIIPSDNTVGVDGVYFSELNLSYMDSSIHAVQWYDTHGEVEIKDPVTGRMVANVVITSLNEFQPAIDAWQKAKDEVDALIAEQEAIAAELALVQASA